MFYNLQETMSRLSLSEPQVMDLVRNSELQHFKDRDILLFSQSQVDSFLDLKEEMDTSRPPMPPPIKIVRTPSIFDYFRKPFK